LEFSRLHFFWVGALGEYHIFSKLINNLSALAVDECLRWVWIKKLNLSTEIILLDRHMQRAPTTAVIQENRIKIKIGANWS
jgi:hypothetical protein